MTKKQKVTKEPIDPTNLKVTGTLNKENEKIKKSGGIKNIFKFKGFHQGSKQTNQVTKSPMAPTNLNVTGVIDKEDHGAAQTNQVIEAPVNPIEMGENGTAKKKLGTITKLKVRIFNKQYISTLIKELKEINAQLLKNKDGKIDEKIKAELIEGYNIRFESNTLLEVIYKNQEYNYNTTPLLLAVQSNLTEVAQAILSITDANLHIQDNEGMNVLHYAAKNNDELTVKTLLQKKLQVNVEDKKGKTALHYAALNGHIDVIKALIAGGADINVKDKDGNTALHHATENNYYSIVKTLLQHGANINALDKNRKTPLFYALTKNHSILANFMMTKGALLEIKDTNQETSHYNGQNELLADTSLERDTDVNDEDEDGKTALHHAAENNCSSIVIRLLQHGAKINALDKEGNTPLFYALTNNHFTLANFMMTKGALLEIKDNNQETSHYNGQNELLADTSLERDTDVNAKDKDGKTALHHAAENNCSSIVIRLLQHGAKINALDKEGNTPLFYALTNNHFTLANFMMTKGALLEIKDTNQETSHYNGQYELFAGTSLETSDAITTREGADLFDEQSTDTSLENTSNYTTASESESLSDKQPTKFDDSHTSFVDIPLPNSTLEENLSDEQPITSEAQTQPTHDETRKHPWLPLRKVPKIKLPSQPNEARGTYKIVILVASAATIITASMLTYFTTLPTLAIIGIAFASALVFGSIATLKPMSKMDDTDCSHVRNDSKNLFV